MSKERKTETPNYISVQQYADNHNIPVINLLEDIVAGKYKSQSLQTYIRNPLS